ncbi:hypothetical protein [Acetobacter oeni]|uniref:Uncharacterized protein n=1 Tax=Acetobacter oeni TaxID=304077 RepID=A0A511XLE0_9PROT|nr:hypothetical protein [Acetobacter oeni]MBB3883528.1 hypothetical protein [Acetobacter oeni]NHO19567.1 hypothetical protein [Acetobacter oeni]GBR03105.1 hypothetical protein AA21952_0960 [Acetobacter oeni LMG 21952]GEN63749.1 hypothetical protein AOE01nite_19730 [Acetobacter oeni]
MSDEDNDNEVIAGYLIQREYEEDEFDFWDPENEWQDDPNEAKLYESEEEAEHDAKALQTEDSSMEISVAVVIEDDEEDDEDEDEE